jgi:lipoyl(octanoyl) transferase
MDNFAARPTTDLSREIGPTQLNRRVTLRPARAKPRALIQSRVFNSRLASRASLLAPHDAPPVEWVVTPGLTPYPDALAEMEAHAEAITRGAAPERVWLLEHPALYTAGTSAKDSDLVEARFPVHRAGRGGQFTYHGPGQRVAYVMLDLKRRRPDVRAYVVSLEHWLIEALAAFDVVGETRENRVGVWVARPDKLASPLGEPAEDKIAAIGVRVRRWVTFHGVSLNVDPDLTHFSGIVPCGIAEAHYGVTSLAALGRPTTMAQVDVGLRGAFETLFGPTRSG